MKPKLRKLNIQNILTILVITIILFVLGCTNPTPQYHDEIEAQNGWAITTEQIDGNRNRTINFTARELTLFYMQSFNEYGEIVLTITQGATEKVLDITGEFAGYLDMSGFRPGEIRLDLDFDSAQCVNIALMWDDTRPQIVK